MSKKITSMTVTEQVDSNGEVVTRSMTNTFKIPQEEDYVKLYLKHVHYLCNLPNGLDAVIYELLSKMNYENDIVLNAGIKKKIAKNIGKELNTVNQYISKLVHYGVLIRIDTGVYKLNPMFYGKGSWKNILELRESLEMNIQYSDSGVVITHKYGGKNG